MRGLLSTLLFCILLTVTATASTWSLTKIEGRDYVPLDNVAKFYNFGGVQTVGNDFALRTPLRSLRGQKGSKEFYINNLKFILSFPIVEQHGKLYISRMDLTKLVEPVLRPGRITNGQKITTVVLDAGHGGHDKGATNLFGMEKNYTLDVALRARALLQKAGFKVIMTRTSDVFIPLEQRAKIANQHPNAVFISIHFNASTNRLATGIETYTLAPQGVPSMASDGPAATDFIPYPGNGRDPENIALACATHAAMISQSRMFDRGIKRARFVVIREATVPGVLIEGGFLTNLDDARRIATPTFRQQLAGCILKAAINYRNAVGGPSLPMAKNDSGSSKRPIVITPTSSKPIKP